MRKRKPKFDRLLLWSGFTRTVTVSLESDGSRRRDIRYWKEKEGDWKFVVEVRSDGNFNCSRYRADRDEEFPDDWDGGYILDRSCPRLDGKVITRTGSSGDQVVQFLRGEGVVLSNVGE